MCQCGIVVRMEIHDLERLVEFERTHPSVVSYAVIVIQTIGDIAVLLDLRHDGIATHGMHRSGRDIGDIACAYLIFAQVAREGTVLNGGMDQGCIHLFVPPKIDRRFFR